MNIGISVLLMAIGAVLIWAVTASVAGISINVLGVILLIAGIVGLVVSLVAAERSPGDPAVRR